MTNGTDNIPASSNSSLAPLSVNSWGYNTNVRAISRNDTVPVLLKPLLGRINLAITPRDIWRTDRYYEPEGSYNVSVTYTAVGLTD